jgi:hypothetical protein
MADNRDRSSGHPTTGPTTADSVSSPCEVNPPRPALSKPPVLRLEADAIRADLVVAGGGSFGWFRRFGPREIVPGKRAFC